jgi:tight adherence protein C
MRSVLLVAVLSLSAVSAASLASLALQLHVRRRASRQLQERVGALGGTARKLEPYQDGRDVAMLLRLAHAVEVSGDLREKEAAARDAGEQAGISPRLFSRNAGSRRGVSMERERQERELILHAGLADHIDQPTFHHVRTFVLLMAAVVCGALGSLVSPALAPLGILVGVLAGYRWPMRVLTHVARRRKEGYERDLPFMLGILSLCLQTGMSFDAALGVFCRRIDSALARDCERMRQCYLQGLETREESLGRLAREIDLSSFDRFVEVTTQALRFGAPLADVMADLSEEARKEYRARVSEQIAKAPVRMLVPTGTLILPAMLLFVLGPVVLNIVGEVM